MGAPVTLREDELRARLDVSVRRLRSTMNAYPAGIEQIDGVDLTIAGERLDDATDALAEAMDVTTSIEQLTEASEEAVLLASTSRMALRVVREVLTLLCAEIDSRRVA